MAQYTAWNREYEHSTFLTKDQKPQSDVLRALKYLKKTGVPTFDLTVLDLGSGAGRNSNYLASKGNIVTGIEISDVAVAIARDYATKEHLGVTFIEGDIGASYQFPDNHFDLLLDITSSNSLNENERAIYLSESFRVLKPGGYFIVKALCKEGDENAKKLIAQHPGGEKDTYLIQELGLIERVFSKEDFEATYKQFFTILELKKKTSYTRMNNRVYKRNFWIAYLQKQAQP